MREAEDLVGHGRLSIDRGSSGEAPQLRASARGPTGPEDGSTQHLEGGVSKRVLQTNEQARKRKLWVSGSWVGVKKETVLRRRVARTEGGCEAGGVWVSVRAIACFLGLEWTYAKMDPAGWPFNEKQAQVEQLLERRYVLGPRGGSVGAD